ncbi:hypothetical protein ACIBQX_48835 [Nonomuraea sp. NPDC049714]|uniref:hypothetical protein n=1 Tax=Nonomuraea sp. NPDC049714 TaxID=3364357 RepID=UPI00379FE179
MPAGTSTPDETAAYLDKWALAHAQADGRDVGERPVSGGLARMSPLIELMTLTDRSSALREEFLAHMTSTLRTVLLPDLDIDLTHAMTELEELLLTYGGWEEDGGVEAGELPAPLAAGAALNALRRVWDAIAPTQGERATKAGRTGRLLASDGRYEFVPLRLVDVEAADVDILAAAARVLGDPSASDAVREGLEEGRASMPAGELVMRAAQLAGLLDLADTDDTELLRERLAAAGPADDVVLTETEEQAYRRTVDRVNGMWTLGDPVERFRYDGDRRGRP